MPLAQAYLSETFQVLPRVAKGISNVEKNAVHFYSFTRLRFQRDVDGK